MLRIKILGILMSLAVGVTAVSGCKGFSVTAGLTSASSATSLQSESETAAAATSAANGETKQAEETAGSREIAKITAETIKTKRTALMTGDFVCAVGTTYLGESENQAAMENVLAEMGVDEGLLKDPSRLIDCSGSDIWLICISDDVNSFKVVMGDDENGEELFKAEKGNIPEYIFIRCFSSGEMAPCTVIADGEVSGDTFYQPTIIGDQIVIPNGGQVLNQSEGYETYIDVPGDTDNNDDTEEEEP